MTIVVVDDEPGLARAFSRVLVGAGYRVLTHSSSSDALHTIQTSHVDMLVSDVVMPGLSGFELATAARLVKPELPILLVSAYFDSAMAEGAPKDVIHLDKPVPAVDLVNTVGKALEEAKRASSTRTRALRRDDD